MPNYPGSAKAELLRENQQKYLWANETVTPGSLSIAFELARVPRTFYPYGLSFEVTFSAAPGTFEIDIMGANNDVVGSYVSLGTISTVSANVGRWDMPSNLWPKYVAASMKSLTNPVSLDSTGDKVNAYADHGHHADRSQVGHALKCGSLAAAGKDDERSEAAPEAGDSRGTPTGSGRSPECP